MKIVTIFHFEQECGDSAHLECERKVAEGGRWPEYDNGHFGCLRYACNYRAVGRIVDVDLV